MGKQNLRIAAALGLAMLLTAGVALAQDRQAQHIYLPMASPKASVSQTLGVTDIAVTYHRPAVNDRELWGALVPYDQVWRTGANENTLVSFSTDVEVAGEPLAAGSYGLHTIPGEGEWTVIFSSDTTDWGSFSYDSARDALRVKVKTADAPFHQERMAFTFEDVTGDSATLALHWADLHVPIPIAVDTHELAVASFRDQLKGLAAFFWQGWNQAASYCLQNDVHLDQALEWVDRSIQAQENFTNLSTKAQILDKMGKSGEAAEIMARALPRGNGGELHNYARQLLGQDRKQEALEVFKRNLEQNSEAWFVELGLARGYSAVGDFKNAVKYMKQGLERTPEPQKDYVRGLIAQLEKGEDIN